MPSSAVRNFSDPDDFAAAIRAAKVELTVTGRGAFAAKVTRIDLHRMWLQRIDDNLPRIAHSANVEGRAIVMFVTGDGPEMLRNGSAMRVSNLRRCPDGQAAYERSAGNSVRGTMSLPVGDMVEIGSAVAGCDLAPPRNEQIVTPGAAAMAYLRRLHAAVGYLADHAPEIIANPEAARGLEQELIRSMVACLKPAEAATDKAASGRRDVIMKRFRTMLEANPDRAVHMAELSSAIGVSERTLHACCYEQLGMSPLRYLWLRRMNLARAALSLAEANAATVTEIATGKGFWELGRFAVAYRQLFGESPSVTLSRPPRNI